MSETIGNVTARLHEARNKVLDVLVSLDPDGRGESHWLDIADAVIERLTEAGWHLTHIGDAELVEIPANELHVGDWWLIEGDRPLQVTYAEVITDAAPDGTVKYRAGGFPGALTMTPDSPTRPVTVWRGPFDSDDE